MRQHEKRGMTREFRLIHLHDETKLHKFDWVCLVFIAEG